MHPRDWDFSRRLIVAALIAGVLGSTAVVVGPFLIPLAWGAILAYVIWPLYRWLSRSLRWNSSLCALILTASLALVLIILTLWLGQLLNDEFARAYRLVTARLADHSLHVPDFVLRIPWMGEAIRSFLERAAMDPTYLKREVFELANRWFDELAMVAGGIGRNIGKGAVSMVVMFFLLRDGPELLVQIDRILKHYIGDHGPDYLDAIGKTIRAVVYGLLLTAFAQGILAGIGYWFVGLDAPVLMAAITTLFALIPFGAPLVWGTAGIWLILTGETVAGLGLLAWGMLAVSWIDNLVRPIVISASTHIPFLLVLFGVGGGVIAFGLIGLFVGPVVVAIFVATWREWLDQLSKSPAVPSKAESDPSTRQS